ncbi:uncharacterized protein LOC115914556 isoform X2 [Camarhynchus parvulus]|uniref:uncharacterized protein LOC115914556 isoform X2 n=1 Tax=Geospiza parvula TaxID=87175 RepID=UPI001237EB70|nr:uncharacterized protein LOC115914556 isoform X2 [Camarhynchus parvulus]
MWDLLTWTSSPGSAHLSTPRTSSACGICSPGPAHLEGSVPLDLLTPCGTCSPGPAHLGPAHLSTARTCSPEHSQDLLALWDLLTWTCSPCGTCSPGPAHVVGPAPGPVHLDLLMLWDLLTWTCSPCGPCSPEHCQDLLTWTCSCCRTCSPGPAHVVGPAHLDLLMLWDLLTWTCSPCGTCSPEHCQDLLTWTCSCCRTCSPGGICSPGPAQLSTPRTCSPCGTCSPEHCQDLPPWMPPWMPAAPRSQGPKSPNPAAAPPRSFPEFWVPRRFPTLGSDPQRFWGSPGAPGGVKKGLRGSEWGF